MTLTAVINPVVPLNLLFPLQRVICPQSRQSEKYRIVTHNFTSDDLTNGKSPSYHPEPRRCGSMTPSPSFSPSSLTTLESSTSEKRTSTTSSKPCRNSAPSPSTVLVPYSADSPLTGNMPHAPVTSPCQSIYKQPC